MSKKPIKCVYNSTWCKMLGVNAQTLGHTVKFADKKEDVKASTAAHELVHILQIEKMGALKFYVSYVFSFITTLLWTFSYRKAMTETPLESPAYAQENDKFLQELARQRGLLD